MLPKTSSVLFSKTRNVIKSTQLQKKSDPQEIIFSSLVITVFFSVKGNGTYVTEDLWFHIQYNHGIYVQMNFSACNFYVYMTTIVILFYSNIYPTRYNVTQFILSGNCSPYFGWYLHQTSGAQTTVSTTSAICHAVTATCRYSGRLQ
jgi:hypothetical protein